MQDTNLFLDFSHLLSTKEMLFFHRYFTPSETMSKREQGPLDCICWWFGAFFFGTFAIFLCFKALALQDNVFRTLVFKADLSNATSACLSVLSAGWQRNFCSVLSAMGLRAASAMVENNMFCSEFPMKCLQLKSCFTFAKTLKKSCVALIALIATICLYFLSSTSHS